MNREQLFKLAEKHGKQKGKKSHERVLIKIRSALFDYFGTTEGKLVLKHAPKKFDYGNIDSGGTPLARELTENDAIEEMIRMIEEEW
jgi:hypothetical protein